MKKALTTTVLFTALFLFGCDPAATFTKPQPEGGSELTSFPERLQGKYMAADQASVLAITDKLMIRNYDYDFKQHKDSIGKDFRLEGDTLLNLADGTKEVVLLKGDSIVEHVNWADTLFHIQENNVLKKFKGHYFLNSRYSDTAWTVRKVWLHKGELTVAGITNQDEVQKLKEITETTADTISTNFSLTRRKFKQFVKQEGFGSGETFRRIAGADK